MWRMRHCRVSGEIRRKKEQEKRTGFLLSKMAKFHLAVVIFLVRNDLIGVQAL